MSSCSHCVYILACYGSFIELTAKNTAAIVYLRIGIVLMRERPLKAHRRGIVSLTAISIIYLGSHGRRG